MVDFKISFSIIGKIFAYIYDFFTYKKIWNVRILFEEDFSSGEGWHTFILLCINNTSYNIKIKKLYLKDDKGILELGESKIDNRGYSNIEYGFQEKVNINLFPSDTQQREFLVTHMGDYKNQKRIAARYKGGKTYLFLNYEILDIKKSFFVSDVRTIKVVLPF